MPGPKAPEQERKQQILDAALRVATRDRLDGLSTRRVAVQARLSHGLVFFHFKSKDALLVALLDWLLEEMAAPQMTADLLAIPSALDRMLEFLRREIARFSADRRRVELFFDYWVMGTRHPEIRQRIRGALERYRELLRPMAEEIVREAPDRFSGVTADGLAAVAVGFIEGCAVQAVIDPGNFDVEQFMTTAERLVAQLGVA
jgi:TetR/AcrR family transcriptional regulator, transcriptional repressor of bet genes